MRRILFGLALAAATATAAAHGDKFGTCDIDSDYGLQITPQALLFSRDDGAPARIEPRSSDNTERKFVTGSFRQCLLGEQCGGLFLIAVAQRFQKRFHDLGG